MKTSTIARAIERDLLREREEKPDAPHCHACGRPYLYRPPPPDGDDSSRRFCSARCRESYDDGLPAWSGVAEKEGHRWTPSLTGWRIIAGPPQVEIGSNPWEQFVNRSPKRPRLRRKKRTDGQLVDS
jgi:hypothetical protein